MTLYRITFVGLNGALDDYENKEIIVETQSIREARVVWNIEREKHKLACGDYEWKDTCSVKELEVYFKSDIGKQVSLRKSRSIQGITVRNLTNSGYKIWRSPGLPTTSYPMELINEEKNIKITFDGLICKFSVIVLDMVECSLFVPASKLDEEYIELAESVLIRLADMTEEKK